MDNDGTNCQIFYSSQHTLNKSIIHLIKPVDRITRKFRLIQRIVKSAFVFQTRQFNYSRYFYINQIQ